MSVRRARVTEPVIVSTSGTVTCATVTVERPGSTAREVGGRRDGGGDTKNSCSLVRNSNYSITIFF